MKTRITLFILALTLTARCEDISPLIGDYTFAATGENIPLEAGIATLSTNDEGKIILSLTFANRTWNAPFELLEHQAKRPGEPILSKAPFFDTVFIVRSGEFHETLILSGTFEDGSLSGEIMLHQGGFTRQSGETFHTGTFVLQPTKKPNKRR